MQFLAVGLHGVRNHYDLCGDCTPRVAFVLPAWNEADVLGASIDSLMRLSYPRGAWLAALGTFAAFAAVSGYLGWIGVASCGCFGVIKASPWWAFARSVGIAPASMRRAFHLALTRRCLHRARSSTPRPRAEGRSGVVGRVGDRRTSARSQPAGVAPPR